MRIGNTLKHNYTNSLTWLISSNESLKYIGLKPSKKIKLYNGKLETRLVCFDIYAGSKNRGTELKIQISITNLK